MNSEILLIMLLFGGNLTWSMNLDIAQSYETKLDKSNPEVSNFVRTTWDSRIKEANSPLILDAIEIEKAAVQIVGSEKWYIILSKIMAHFDFETDDRLLDRFCFLIVHTKKTEPNLFKCFREFRNPKFRAKGVRTSEEEAIKATYDYYYENHLI